MSYDKDGNYVCAESGNVYASAHDKITGKPPLRKSEQGNMPNLQKWTERAIERWKR